MFEVFLPEDFSNSKEIYYSLNKGSSFNDVSAELAKRGIIKNALFFNLYTIFSLNYSKLQAGNYNLSSSMSIADIVKKLSSGSIVKNKITIIEGWDIADIANNVEEKHIYSKEDFILATKNDWSTCIASAQPSTQLIECSGFSFDFIKDLSAQAGKPKNMDLEGYIFPDTYYISENSFPKELINVALSNFDKKLTPELRQEITKQKKSVFQIVTMASMIEKEVRSLEDKKIVAGILWKRIKEGIPLQVDATVNYATGKNSEKVAISDTKIDSPYNTYKYYGLPKGPISNPGIDSILAAIYPEKTDYWYYLTADETGKTIFSKTLDEHIANQIKYFR